MALAPTPSLAALAQQTRSFTVGLHATVADATPLFGPIREAEWTPDWLPHFLHPDNGAQHEGVLFTTTTPTGREQLWMLTDYDIAAGRVAYVNVASGVIANQITIRLVPDGDRQCRATITYRRSALVPAANDEVNQMDAQWAVHQRLHWETAINAALAKARPVVIAQADVELARALERCEVPPEGFPHASHLRVAWVHLSQSASLDQAIERMASTLRRFAVSVGKAEKYSDATTVFWMLQVAAARAVMPGADLDAVLRAYPRLLDKDFIRGDDSHAIAPGAPHPSSDAPGRPVSGRPA